MITIYDIAKHCGVSSSTVSKVINNYESIPLKTKEKVLAAMKELNFVPNVGAVSLSKGRSFNVGILAYFGTKISPFKHHLFTDILDAFQEEMNRRNYDLLFISRNVMGKDETFYKNCISRRVDGVLILGDTKEKELAEVIGSSLPSIAFDYLGNETSGVTSEKDTAYKLVDYLIKLGHKKIAYISGDIENDITQVRYQEYLKCLIDNNISYNNEFYKEARYFDTSSIDIILDSLLTLKDRPTAIMMPDDYSAITAIKLLNQKGFKCPEDISVTGFDGLEIASLITPSITTMKQDTTAIGKALAKKLINLMKDKEEKRELIKINASLIVGESTKKI